jgi:hypothetical protein
MARPRYSLTPELQREIIAFIRAGGFPHVAAEAAGIPRHVFARWLERGQKSARALAHRALALAVLQAQAQARLHAETTVFTEKPLDWLKSGPGRETVDHPGWTTPAKPRTADPDAPDPDRMRAEVFDLIGQCVKQLGGHPNVRVDLAPFVAKLRR